MRLVHRASALGQVIDDPLFPLERLAFDEAVLFQPDKRAYLAMALGRH